jgi:hypothetical protein
VKRLPGIVAAAPKLPFQIINVVQASLSHYDRAAGVFHVSPSQQSNFDVLGSPTNLILNEFTWPASEQEARAFAASQAGSSSYHAFVAIPMTITGVVKEEKQAQGGANGLPGGYRWQIETGEPFSLRRRASHHSALYVPGQRSG